MRSTVLRILVVFTVGFLAIGAILGFVTVGDCGTVFAPEDPCAADLPTQRSFVIAFIGLGLTTLAAAIFADQRPEQDHEPRQDDRA